MSRIFKIAAVAVAVLATAGTVAAQSPQRFSDVPASHPAHEAIEWAAVVGLTTGYEDGTFRPGVALSKRHAVVFMERFYDQILEAEESEGFTRADMMVLLKEMANQTPEPAATTAPPTSGIYFVDQYWSADGETYYVVIGNVDNLSYCEVPHDAQRPPHRRLGQRVVGRRQIRGHRRCQLRRVRRRRHQRRVLLS